MSLTARHGPTPYPPDRAAAVLASACGSVVYGALHSSTRDAAHVASSTAASRGALGNYEAAEKAVSDPRIALKRELACDADPLVVLETGTGGGRCSKRGGSRRRIGCHRSGDEIDGRSGRAPALARAVRAPAAVPLLMWDEVQLEIR